MASPTGALATGPDCLVREAMGLVETTRTGRIVLLLAVLATLSEMVWLAAANARPVGLVLLAGAGVLAGGGLGLTGLTMIRRASRRTARLARSLAAQAIENRALSAANRRLELTGSRYHAALRQLPQGVLLLAWDESVVVCNEPFLAMLGLPAESGQSGETLRALLARGAAEASAQQIHQILLAGVPAVQRCATPDGRSFSAQWTPIRDGGWLCVSEDTTDRRVSERRIAHMVRHDALTGLPNRLALRDALQASLVRARGGEAVWVHCLDVDRFKQINDTLGHEVGDEVLREVARRLRAAVREDDVLAHLGSDEFAVIQFDSGPPGPPEIVARRLVEVLGHPYAVGGEIVVAGASVGIAPVQPDEYDADAVLRRADLALECAKQEGRQTWRFFDAAMDAAARHRRELEIDLRKAVHGEQFELYYQPLVSVRDRRVSGLEALIRWRHPSRGMILPADFIPLAEELGLIVPIGEWVLRTACLAAAQWPGSVAVAVNLSPAQFLHPGLLDRVRAALADSGLPARRLEVEITESVLLTDDQDTLDVLHSLRAMGVRISMDDFGTGYSSLSYLRSFPFDKLKIDKSFVSGPDQGEGSQVIVRAIAALGASLGMATTAEGVETLEQLERLVADGCTEVQGYFFSPPCPAGDIPRLLVEIAVRGACTDDTASPPASRGVASAA